MPEPHRTAHHRWFLAGGAATAALAVSPLLHQRAGSSLAAHMVQHVLLVNVAGPLLGAAALLPPRRRRRRSRWGAALVAAVAGHTLVLSAWHLPDLYQAAAGHHLLHAGEHASLLAVAVVLWHLVARSGRRTSRGAGVVAVFVALLPATALGAAMTLAPVPWYPRYATGTRAAALADQQLAGVVMWAGGGLLVVAAALVLFASWVAAVEGRSPATTATSHRPARQAPS